jgi:hypothetical protein
MKVAAVVSVKVVSWVSPRETGESKKYSLKLGQEFEASNFRIQI